MTTKIQRLLVEIQYVFEEEDSPVEEGEDLDTYIEEEVHMGNFIVRKNVVEDYKGTRDSDYKPIMED